MTILQNFDQAVLDMMQSLRCGFLDSFVIYFSYVTTSGIIWVVLGVVMLFIRKTRATGIILLSSLALVFLTGDLFLKHVINRARPFSVNPDIMLLIKTPSGASFPSTHSCLAAASTVVLFAKNKLFGFIALMLTVCIAFSRLYLYVHYPTDVLAGLVLGVLCAWLVLHIFRKVSLGKRCQEMQDSVLHS